MMRDFTQPASDPIEESRAAMSPDALKALKGFVLMALGPNHNHKRQEASHAGIMMPDGDTEATPHLVGLTTLWEPLESLERMRILGEATHDGAPSTNYPLFIKSCVTGGRAPDSKIQTRPGPHPCTSSRSRRRLRAAPVSSRAGPETKSRSRTWKHSLAGFKLLISRRTAHAHARTCPTPLTLA